VPPWLTKITERICEGSGLFPSAINHVLINEYLPNQGIMPHQDGPAYFPVVAILSLGSPAVMDFTPHPRVRSSTNRCKNTVGDQSTDGEALAIEAEKWKDNHHPSVLLMPRSLLIFKDDAYSGKLHGIKESEVQQYDGVVNEFQALKHNKLDPPSAASKKAVEVLKNEDVKVIDRTTNRISLTCRLVLKVHKNLFKF
ncbi:LOW QUALITY PROTEIN: 2OG-FeII_Oxy_2 domain-containing protein, partial [Cephalotus follicularis]